MNKLGMNKHKCILSVADSTSEWFTGMAYGFGSFQTYDGAKYESNKVGQFLLTSITTATAHAMDLHIVRVGAGLVFFTQHNSVFFCLNKGLTSSVVLLKPVKGKLKYVIESFIFLE